MSARHGTFSLLQDGDLLLAMDAIRRELRNPQSVNTSIWSYGQSSSVSSLVQQLASLQGELNFRIAEKEASK